MHMLLSFVDIKPSGLASTLQNYLTSDLSVLGRRFEGHGGREGAKL